jgi:hypothetical protein
MEGKVMDRFQARERGGNKVILRGAAAAAALALMLVGAVRAQSTAKPPIPGNHQLGILIQTAVVAVSQANMTGNYSVLHDMASPEFQKANPPQKLAKIFADVRKIDLTPVIIFSPVLAKHPAIDDKNMLRLTGYYETSPQRVLFDLLFQPVQGHWRLFGISIRTQIVAKAEEKAAPKKDEKARKSKKNDEKAK